MKVPLWVFIYGLVCWAFVGFSLGRSHGRERCLDAIRSLPPEPTK